MQVANTLPVTTELHQMLARPRRQSLYQNFFGESDSEDVLPNALNLCDYVAVLQLSSKGEVSVKNSQLFIVTRTQDAGIIVKAV